MTDIDTSPEAVERLARDMDDYGARHCVGLATATLRALSARLEAAEAQRERAAAIAMSGLRKLQETRAERDALRAAADAMAAVMTEIRHGHLPGTQFAAALAAYHASKETQR